MNRNSKVISRTFLIPWNITVIAVLLLATSIPVMGGTDWANLEPAIVLKAISIFEADPSGTNGARAMSVIVNFADASTNVHVSIEQGLLPWMAREPEVTNGNILLAAFVAGNIRPQLETRNFTDHAADGVLFMCRVYSHLRTKGRIGKIPELEQWTTMDKEQITKMIAKIRGRSKKAGPQA